MKRRIIVSILTLCMVLSVFSGCGKKAAGSGSVKMDKDHVYKEDLLNYDVNADNIQTSFVSGDRIYFVLVEYDDINWDEEIINDGAMGKVVTTDVVVDEVFPDDGFIYDEPMYSPPKYKIVSFKFDGSDKKEMELPIDDSNGYAYQYSADSNGNIYYILSQNESGETADGVWYYKEKFSVVKVGTDGKEIYNISLNEFAPEIEYLYVKSMHVTGDGELIVLMDNLGMLIFDEKGNKVSEDKALVDYSAIYLLENNEILVSKWGERGLVFCKYDRESKTLSKETAFPDSGYRFNIYGGKYYDFYLTDNMGIYGYNIADEAPVELLNFVDSDINTTYVNFLAPISETEFIISYSSMTDYDYRNIYTKVTKVNPEDVVEKQVLTLACYYLDYDTRQWIIKFNKSNPKYRVSVTDYSMYDVYTEDTYVSGVTQLNTDIVAGKVPDILISTQDFPITTYAAKGLFEDLYKFLDKDSTIKKENLLGNVLKACEYQGKLIQLVPRFYVLTFAGKQSLVGDRNSWTMDDLLKAMNAMPEDAQVLSEVTRDTVLDYCMVFTGNQFINWDKGTCSFDSIEFVKVLEFTNQFPKEIRWDKFDEEDWNNYMENYQTQYINNKTLLKYVYLSDLPTYSRMKQTEFREDISFIGFPTDGGQGSAIGIDSGFSISAKSKNKDGAWEFVRHFFTEEYQSTIDYELPLSVNAYDALIEKAKQRPFYYDENNNKVEYDETYYIGDVEVIIKPSTDKDIEEVMTFIKSVDSIYRVDEDLMNIIREEAEAFYAGKKSAEEVSKIIQSRASIYVSENY